VDLLQRPPVPPLALEQAVDQRGVEALLDTVQGGEVRGAVDDQRVNRGRR
jgi:hypothetical protein